MLINIPRRQIIGGLLVAVLFAAMIALGLSHPSPADDSSASQASDFSPYVTKDGGISRPTDYRDTFEYLGSYAVATKPDKPLDEMHVVYARPEDVRAYRRDGKFPDGATLVKEVTRVGSERLTTGQSHWATDVKLWFVMIKDAKGRFSPYVTKDGGITRPTDYRDTFEYLGSYAVATKPDKPPDEMHVVYARPEDVRAYRRDGKFPDGATLVKEVTRVGSERLTTGQSHWATDVKLWFVMIKDAKGRFPDNDLWGDGWGWALFLAKEPARNVATDYSTDCRTCHVPAKKDDWVYIRGYPVLKK